MKKKTKSGITWLEEKVQKRYFGKTPFYGKRFRYSSGPKTGQLSTIIVEGMGTKGFDVADFDDNPSSQKLSDVYHDFSPAVRGAPIKSEDIPMEMIEGFKFGSKKKAETVVNVGMKEKEEEDKMEGKD